MRVHKWTVLDATLCDIYRQWLATGRCFSPVLQFPKPIQHCEYWGFGYSFKLSIIHTLYRTMDALNSKQPIDITFAFVCNSLTWWSYVGVFNATLNNISFISGQYSFDTNSLLKFLLKQIVRGLKISSSFLMIISLFCPSGDRRKLLFDPNPTTQTFPQPIDITFAFVCNSLTWWSYVRVFNATFNDISFISGWSVLLV
jgi:hypothetical protein